jgi:hypothetical protein
MKEPKTSNPYRPVVIYAPPPPAKENAPSRFNISSMVDRIKWFYAAPVIRYYYNLVSIFPYCYLQYLTECCHLIRYLDILCFISGSIQLCSSGGLFSIEYLRRKSIRNSKLMDSNFRNPIAHLHVEFDYR